LSAAWMDQACHGKSARHLGKVGTFPHELAGGHVTFA
jgi:hypothetical protein